MRSVLFTLPRFPRRLGTPSSRFKRWTANAAIGVVLGVVPPGATTIPQALAAPSAWPSDTMALRVPGPLSPRNASYRLAARLDEKTHEVKGQGTLIWRNLERKEASELSFNLYQNAFKHHATTFIREAGAQLRGDEMPEHGFGAIDLSSLKIGGVELISKAQVIDSVLKLKLDTPVGPGSAIEIEFSFTTKLPRTFARSGYSDDFHAVTQWFPKIGVFECDKSSEHCGFRTHQYHGFTEFFSDHGSYEVTVDVPEKFVVGATGIQIAEQKSEGRKKLTFRADDVRDFAWFADPKFVEYKNRVTDKLGDVEVRVLNRPGLGSLDLRHFQGVRAAIHEGEHRYFSYPYKNVTVIVPPRDSNGAGGMEYPTLITSFLSPMPDGVRIIESVDAHEFGHQWVPMMINSDEVEDAWLDEGLNQTFTGQAMDRLFPDGCSSIKVANFCLGDRDVDWMSARGVLRRMPLSTPSFRLSGRTYGSMTYAYTSLMMRSLENYLGPERMVQAMRHYAERYRFHKPRPADFMSAISEGAGEDLSWFWNQAVTTTRVADYEILQVDNQKHELAYGLWDCPPKPPMMPDHVEGAERVEWLRHLTESNQAACVGKPAGRHELSPPTDKEKKASAKDKGKDKQLWDSLVVVRRRGELIYPVDVVIKFEDGSQEQVSWSLAEQNAHPEERMRTLRFYRRAALERAEVDPQIKLALDEKRLNNGLLAKPNMRPVTRLFLTVQSWVQTALDLISL